MHRNAECLITYDIYMGVQVYNIQSPMRRVSYLYNDSFSKYQFSKQHPMKTKRLKMTHSLVKNYQLNDYLRMFKSKEASKAELCSFHDPSYIDYLENWVIGKKDEAVKRFRDDPRRKIREDVKLKQQFKINKSFDCPGFEGLYNFCQLAAGGSIDAANLILTGISDIAINWAGGYHHAKKSQASGFCYVNDIVLCILQLLKQYPRVLYLDIDVHHGDGVEQAFYHTNRVMTVSFHQFDQDFFPGTGALDQVGEGIGKYFTVNVPLKKGIDDITYFQLFRKVMDTVMASYRPDALVIQCGADSLSKDRLGHLNLSIRGHAECLNYMLRFGLPSVILGGGGYTIENVARCWTYETAAILGVEIDNKIPERDLFFSSYSQDDHNLHFQIQKRPNQNTKVQIDNILKTVVQNMRESDMRPSIAFHSVPKNYLPEQELEWIIISEDENSMDDSLCEQVFKGLQ